MKFKNVKLAIGASLLALSLVACAGSGNNGKGGNDQATNNSKNTANASKGAESGDLDKLGQIAVITREDGSGTRGAFTEITGLLERTANKKWTTPRHRRRYKTPPTAL